MRKMGEFTFILITYPVLENPPFSIQTLITNMNMNRHSYDVLSYKYVTRKYFGEVLFNRLLPALFCKCARVVGDAGLYAHLKTDFHTNMAQNLVLLTLTYRVFDM